MHFFRRFSDSNIKLAILFLNLIYLVLGFSLVGCVVWHRDQTILAMFPPALALAVCGGLLGILSLLGITFTVMNLKKIIFFYYGAMCVLVLLLGALGGICLAATSSDITSLLVRGWINADTEILGYIQSSYQCCGFQDPMGIQHPPCHELACCLADVSAPCCTGHNVTTSVSCPCKLSCGLILEQHSNHSIKVVGGTSLILGLILLFGVMFLLIQQLQEYHQERVEAEQNNEEVEDSSAVSRYERF